MRVKPGKHLSQAGVDLARRVGDGMGHFDRVLTSTLPRAFETAIAMGYAVDEEAEWLTTCGDAVEAETPYPQTFAAYAGAVAGEKAAATFAREAARHWRAVAGHLPEAGCALMISHGGVVELGAIGCLTTDGVVMDYDAWGGPLDYCEGVRLMFAGGRCIGGDVLRVSREEAAAHGPL
jgi:broad specificity phosphatase PhoE